MNWSRRSSGKASWTISLVVLIASAAACRCCSGIFSLSWLALFRASPSAWSRSTLGELASASLAFWLAVPATWSLCSRREALGSREASRSWA